MEANCAAVRAALRQARASITPCCRATNAVLPAKSGETPCRAALPSCGRLGLTACPPTADLGAHALQVRQESAAKLVAQAQKAAQRDELVAALQAQRQRPQSPPSPAAATPTPAARTDKVGKWHIPPSLLLASTGVSFARLRSLFRSTAWDHRIGCRPCAQHGSLHVALPGTTAAGSAQEPVRRTVHELCMNSATHSWLAWLF